ncbi:hypothetical protein E1B28_008861 [Marasmius oreades]|uniref:Uncharacterized protein n=1 Tax=Marasmius oreades TaxID=181124 RepID=A0A9P7UST4_9AGAR|nr:uncharacterized protein E1B28_008861 [Marasmius oreades]KAG7092510.1 hypothetical protein E1B28_008861 [Marasmius oreades]
MTQDKSPYAAISNVPLIKSPSLRVPQPVQLPPDIHPLPDSVTAYFAYPFTLEPHVLAMESSRRETLAAHTVKREAYLNARNDEKERRRREALRKIAPGFEGSVLVPTRASSAPAHPLEQSSSTPSSPPPGHRHTRSVMDDLVDHLAALDSNKSS